MLFSDLHLIIYLLNKVDGEVKHGSMLNDREGRIHEAISL